jgi:hypothetical protein
MKKWFSILLLCLFTVAWAKPEIQKADGSEIKPEVILNDDFTFDFHGVVYLPLDVYAPAVKYIGLAPKKTLDGFVQTRKKPPKCQYNDMIG